MHIALAKTAIPIGAALGLNKSNVLIVANGFDRQFRQFCHFTNIQIAALLLLKPSAGRSNIAQAQRIGQNKDGGQRHGRCCKDGREEHAEAGI